MGQSLTTPLSLTLDHWKDVRDRARDQSVEIKKGKWQTLCTSEWPTYDVGWPVNGTFNKTTILQVKDLIFRQKPYGHPDQVAYIVTWESLAFSPPPWAEPFVDPNWLPVSPKPVSPSPPDPLVASSSLYPALTKEESPKVPPPKPVLPEDPNSPLIDLLLEEPPPYPVPTAPPREEEVEPPARPRLEAAPSPVAGRLRGRREVAPDSTSQAFPLRQGAGGQMQYWPFSAADIYNWKQHNPPFSKDPVALTNLIESVLLTHQPTWDDIQQLLQALLTSEEKQRVLLEARKHVLGDNGRPTLLPEEIDDAFPLTRPDWDFTTAEGRRHLRLYRQLLLAGLRGAARRPTNLAQVKQVVQEAAETPSAFLERPKEAYRMYTPYDPDDPGQMTNVSMSFIWQAAPDIRAKLQRIENLQGYTLQDLLKEAERIYNKRETQEEKEDRVRREKDERDRKRSRELSRILAAVVQGQGKRGERVGVRKGPKLDKDQCAYCKERGHWARDCPKKPSGLRRPRPQTSLLALDKD
uniref:Gag protein n=1 Tax=Recombinant M-MuLV/RaLV retrovirus TaxID=221982 RepID=Q7ZL05_9GAMR|nr:gag protein [Recombinant M-MuLV/RaLV retrovirus]